MTQRTGGSRRKTRHKLKKNVRKKGKVSIRQYLQQFKEEDRVALVAEPAVQTGMHHPRFQGRTGVVVGTQGNCYQVQIRDGKSQKVLVVHPVHLRRHVS